MRRVIFLDDGGVVSPPPCMAGRARGGVMGNHRQRLLGEFLPSVLGGTPEGWAEALGQPGFGRDIRL
ncbi:MAG: hypothetical protein ACOYW9_09055 [Deinococcota bacterium]|uniref:hypothetical protein n=1 Tax=Allomeiothermus silvanus TaxID=52022 RepID=UPI0011D050DB|nr:hypothetical protein [Allomeiothermus silvanus]